MRPRQLHQLWNALLLKNDVGDMYAAAKYLRFCGWSLEAALWWLLKLPARDQ